MKSEKYKEMYETYKKGFSLEDIGKMYGMSRQSVYAGFKCRSFILREKNKLPFLIIDDIKFTLRNNGYYGRTNGERDLMHRYVWIKNNGEIPKGYDIHHINHDKSDNRISNLEMYTKSEHSKKFVTGNNQYGKKDRHS